MGHYVTLRGLRIWYEDRGKGPALFLLHGGTGNHEDRLPERRNGHALGFQSVDAARRTFGGGGSHDLVAERASGVE